MADKTKTLTIRIGAEGSAEVARVMRDIQKSTADAMKKVRDESGNPIKPRFSFDEQLIRNEVARAYRKARAEAARQKLELKAKVIVEEARLDRRENSLRPAFRSTAEQSRRDAEALGRRIVRDFDANAPEKTTSGGDGAITRRASAEVSREVKGFLAQIKAQSKQVKDITDLIRGGGALVIARQVGQALQKLPEVVDQYRDAIKFGTPKHQALAQSVADTIPVVGELAKGFRSLGQVAFDFAEGIVAPRGKAVRERREDRRERERMASEMEAKRDARRTPIIGEGAELGLAAQNALRLNRLTGTARDRESARIDFEAEERRIATLEGQKGGLSPDQQKTLGEQIAAAREANNAKLAEANRKANADDEKEEREHQARIAAIRGEAEEDDLCRRGLSFQAEMQRAKREHAAKIDEIRANARAEREATGDTYEKRVIDRREQEDIAAERARAEEEAARIGDQRSAKLREEAAADAKQQRENYERLRQARIEELETEGRLGNRTAAIEAQKLRIAEEYKRRRAEINEIIRDEGTSQADLKDAYDRRDALDRAEKREMARVGVDTSPQRFASIADSYGTTGIGDAMRAQLANRDPFSPVVEATRQQTSEQRNNTTAVTRLDRTLGEMLTQLRQQQSGQPLLTPLFTGR